MGGGGEGGGWPLSNLKIVEILLETLGGLEIFLQSGPHGPQ